MEIQRQIYIDEKNQMLKGNIHTHTNRVDGVYGAKQVADMYQAENYDFLAITDHDYYDAEVADMEHSGDILLIPGIEATCSYRGSDPALGDYCHFTCLGRKNTDIVFETGSYQTSAEIQRYIDRLKEQYRIVQFNHPLFPKLLDSDWIQLKGYDLLEVYNHKDFFVETGEESAQWLARVLMNHDVRFFVTASDDFHGPRRHAKLDECFGGFLMVQAEKNTESILNAIEQGRFYASTGPTIRHYERVGRHIHIKTSAVSRITFYSNLRRCKQVYHDDGSLLCEAEYELSGNERYIWAKAVDAEGKTVWTQPIFF